MRARLGAGGILVAAAIAAQGLLIAGVADAAGGNASVQGSLLVYTADAGFTNHVVITLANGMYTIDDVVAINPGPGCGTVDATKVTCIANGITQVNVNSGDLADTIVNDTGTPSRLNGDDGNDVITGGSSNDILVGGGGADTFNGRGGSHDGVSYFGTNLHVEADPDGVAGDDGFHITGPFTLHEGDTINTDVEDLYGGSADDILRGDGKANALHGNDGDDTLFGNAGNDTLVGGAGNDAMAGNAGADRFVGSEGIDTVSYAAHTAFVHADPDGVAGDDGTPATGDVVPAEGDTIDADVENLTGSPFADTLRGNSEDNFIAGGGGNDTIDGGLGNDTLDGGAGGDVLSGSFGEDTVTYRFRVNPVKATLDTFANDGGVEDNFTDQITNTVENLIGGTKNDILVGNAFNNTLWGLAGDDSLNGAGGSNTLDGGTHTNGDTCVNGPTFVNCNP